MTRRALYLPLLLIATLTGGPVASRAATYTIDPVHSSVAFQVKHMTISKVKGVFAEVSGTFDFTPGEPANWQALATIPTASIDTGNTKRDEHLRSDEFFDVAKYPTMTFRSTSVQLDDEGLGTLSGELTMHGVTKTVTLDLEYNGTVMDPWGNERAGFSASGRLQRKAWGLSYNAVLEAGGLAVGETVRFSLEIEGIKATE